MKSNMKLKEIPKDTVVHTPTEEEANELLAILHENGYCWSVMWKSLINNNHWHHNKENTTYLVNGKKKLVDVIKEGALMFDILTLAEFKERYCEGEKPRPKFKVGDKVIHNHKNREVGQIMMIDYFPSGKCGYSVCFGKEYHNMAEHQLLPYTEPESKDETMETKDETKELNLCELLQGHEGETFFSPICGVEIEFKKLFGSYLSFYLDKENGCAIECDAKGNQMIGTLDDVGKFQTVTYPHGSCMVYPSKNLYEQYPLDPYTAWVEWKNEQKKPFICIHWGEVDANGDEEDDYTGNIYFRTLSDRDKCIEEIKAVINKNSK